jgi:hypothetical protein
LRWLAKSRTQSRTELKPIEEATANLASCADWSLSLEALAGFFFLDCAEEPEASLALAAARRSRRSFFFCAVVFLRSTYFADQ